MNSKDLIQSLNCIGEDLVNEAEYGSFRVYDRAETVQQAASDRSIDRPDGISDGLCDLCFENAGPEPWKRRGIL